MEYKGTVNSDSSESGLLHLDRRVNQDDPQVHP